MATLKQVAKEAGVSIATVSYVLNGTGSVSKEVSKRVMEVVKRLEYRPNRTAQAMRTGHTRSIGLILPDLTNPFFPELAQKVESAARALGFPVILFDSQNHTTNEEEGFALLDQHQVDGIIWCPASDKTSINMTKIRCPVVLIDRPLAGFDVVHSDYRRGGELLAQHIIELGHKKVGLLSGPQKLQSARQRREGLLIEAGKEIDVVWDIEVPFSSELTNEARKKIGRGDVTLIVAANDLIAVGALSVLNEAGFRVPEDISLLGFDDIPWATVIRPKLTTVSQPIASIAAEAVDLLSHKILNPNKVARKIVLDVELIKRDSAKPI